MAPGSPVPAAPGNLTVERISDSTAGLRWKDTSSNESRFIVWRQDALAYDWVQVAVVARNQTQFTDNTLDSTVNYIYRISVECADGFSSYSNESAAAGGGSESFTIRALRALKDINRVQLTFESETGVTNGSAKVELLWFPNTFTGKRPKLSRRAQVNAGIIGPISPTRALLPFFTIRSEEDFSHPSSIDSN